MPPKIIYTALFTSLLLAASCGGDAPSNTNSANAANAPANSAVNSGGNVARRTGNVQMPDLSGRPQLGSANGESMSTQSSGNSTDPPAKRRRADAYDPVMSNLQSALRTWSSGDEHSSSASLRAVWVGGGRNEKNFYPQGAEQLISAVQRNIYFSQCGRYSGALRTTMFAPGGPIQTVDHLYKRLYRCDPEN